MKTTFFVSCEVKNTLLVIQLQFNNSFQKKADCQETTTIGFLFFCNESNLDIVKEAFKVNWKITRTDLSVLIAVK